MKIPLSQPDIGAREIELVNQVLCSPVLSIGPMLNRFEQMIAQRMGTGHAVGVSSGTAGLHLCVRAAGISDGDEVITTPFSFVASANCILYERGRPVFVDIDPATLNLDVDQIEAKITPRTKAILPVHVFGQPCDMERIMALARRRGLVVIEDACEAMGAEWNRRAVGSFGDCAVFAFYPNKQMTTGEGGVITTDRDDHAALFRSLRNQGRDQDGTWLRHIRLGYNYRLDEMSAALGVAQLERLDELLAKRERVAQAYTARLGEIEEIITPMIVPGVTRMSWFVYVIRLRPPLNRDRIMQRLEEHGIPTRPYFSPIHLQPFYIEQFGYREGDFPVTEQAARSTLALPFHGNLPESQLDYVCGKLRDAIHGEGKTAA